MAGNAMSGFNAEIEKSFSYHPPTTKDVADTHDSIRRLFKEIAKSVDTLVPNSREKALAITKLEEAMMWANAGVARNQ